MNMIDCIREYRKQCWCVIPVPKGQKFPIIEWKKYQAEQPTADQLNTWWKEGAFGNIAIITGAISGNLCVIDFDDVNNDIFDEFRRDYPVVETSSGYHVYTNLFEPLPTSKFKYGDIKCEGGLVIAPPSLHPSGSYYRWTTEIGSLLIDELPFSIELVKEKTTITDMAEGSRNICLTSLAGAMRAKGASVTAILAGITAASQESDNPLPVKELTVIASSVGRYQPTGDDPLISKRDYI